MRIFEHSEASYRDTLAALADRGDSDLAQVEPVVAGILAEVRAGGDRALVTITERSDGRRPEPLAHERSAPEQAYATMAEPERSALEPAARRGRALD